ncbi:MAG: 4Fe-4S dicluster domain-containing protein, partial [Chloroflexi bacterium]|nr:4Fe-4S dicluster domain-containing protein [Chloroflexota bacterium]
EVKTPEGHARYYAVTRCEPISNAVGYLFGTRDWDDKTRSWRNKWVASILDQMQDFEHHDWWRWQRVDELTNRQLGFGLGAGTFIIVPAWRALEKSGCELPPDYVHAGIIARNAEAQGKNILARPCICRIRMREKDCTAPVWTCVPRIEDDPTFGPVTTQDDRRAPNTATTRGQYKRLSPEEFLETWRIAEEDEAMIHIGRANGNYVCTCCDECCDWLTPVKKYVPEPSEAVDPSPFRSVVNKELCQGCPDCVARCQFKAIKIMAVDQSGYPVKDQDAGGLRKAVVDLTKCVGCGQCVLGCGVENALKLELATKINAPPPIWADRLATV